MSEGTDRPPGEGISLNGQPAYHHGAPAAWRPPSGEEAVEEISAHIEQHLGPIAHVFHEILSDTVHLDVHFVKPTPSFPHQRLVTSGMSDLPMSTPPELDVPQHAELMMTLPAGWRLDAESLEDERWYWPVRLLKVLARLPHRHATWLGAGHTIPNADPPEPYAPDLPFTAAIVLHPVTVPRAFHQLELPSRTIAFFAVVPLFQGELDLKLRRGAGDLLERLDRRKVTDIVDLQRRDVSLKRFVLW